MVRLQVAIFMLVSCKSKNLLLPLRLRVCLNNYITLRSQSLLTVQKMTLIQGVQYQFSLLFLTLGKVHLLYLIGLAHLLGGGVAPSPPLSNR